MSAMAGLKLPKGYEQYSLPTRGGQSADIYSMLASKFPELLGQAQGAPGAFDAIEGKARQDFQQKTAPGIANRYAGSGIGSSSGMQNSLSAAGADLDLSLAGKRADYMDQSMQRVLQLGQILLQNPDVTHEYGKKQQKGSIWDQILGIGLPAAGAVAGGIFGGPSGAQLGANVGSAVARPFTNR